MDVIEQSETRLVLVSKSKIFTTYIWGLIALGVGILLTVSGNHSANHNLIYKLIVGPVGVIVGIYTLLSPIKSTLTIDKSTQQLSIRKAYAFGLLPMTRHTQLADLTEFAVQHQLAAGYKPAILKFLFKRGHRKLTFSSNTLHFTETSTFLKSGAFDPRKSSEEALILVVASYVNLPAVPKERLSDSTNLGRRLPYYSLIFVSGFAIALAAIWTYFHVIHTN